MSEGAAGLDRMQRIVGAEHLLSDPATTRELSIATFATKVNVRAICRPADHGQVEQCVRCANEAKIPLYPLSRGRNWGLGCKSPTADGCVLLDLGRLNRITDFNEELGYLTVEPGVTFAQAHSYLQQQGACRMLCTIGGPPDASLIGNALERGDAVGPYGERLAHACALRVVLPSGETIQTGLGRFAGAKATPLHRWGVGPSFDGIFSQSNFGVVTQMTFWLPPLPSHFQSFFFTIETQEQLLASLAVTKQLQSQGVIGANCLAVWNAYKAIASEQQFPWHLPGIQTPLSAERLTQLKKPWGKGDWIGVGGLYSASKAHARADRQLLRQALGPHVRRLVLIDRAKAALLSKLKARSVGLAAQT